MNPVLTSTESKAYDDLLIKKAGLPSLVLMENAARGALAAISGLLTPNKSVIIFCGKGNNGGDGLALARLLLEKEIDVDVVLLSKQLSTDAAHQLTVLKKFLDAGHIHTFPFRDTHFLAHMDIGVIVDALLGTGAKGPLRKQYGEAVLMINGLALHSNAKVLSLDIPTGMDADTGDVETIIDSKPVCVFATKTVAMGALKRGFFQGLAPDVTGDVSIAPLGGPTPESTVALIDQKDIAALQPSRHKTTTKYDQGYVLSIGGSRGMTGAAIMSAEAALRSGCGLVTVATAASERHIVATAMPELMTAPLRDDSDGMPIGASFNDLAEYLPKSDVVLLGPGIRVSPESSKLIYRVLREVGLPIVADAGALSVIAEDVSILKKRPAPTILTPHSGEMARILGIGKGELEKNRIEIASAFAKQHKITLVLKGAPSIIATPSGRVYINSTGNSGMATAGVGDVLAGMIAGILAQDTSEVETASIFATYLHGLAGDIAKRELTESVLTATDIIKHLPAAFKAVEAV
jgi:hydroxyethylthiazole kinase-like uncharacterized protein yjeF